MRRPSRKSAANGSAPRLPSSPKPRSSSPRFSSSLSNNLPIIVAGPTGVGKSAFAAELAHRLGGEILGADAYQVYTGLEILTAQPELPGEVPHHLIGFLPLSESFDAARFVSLAHPLIADIQDRGKAPIVTGGAGMYIKALTHGLEDAPPSDPTLRKELLALSADELRRRLDAADPGAREAIDFQNPRRVLRALEIHLLTGRPVSESRKAWASRETPGFRGLLLFREKHELDARIEANVDAMFARGVVEEVRQARDAGIGPTAAQTLGLREIQALLRGEMSAPECRAAIVLATRRYAKRQLTWFRNQFNFSLIDLTGPRQHEALSSALEVLGIS